MAFRNPNQVIEALLNIPTVCPLESKVQIAGEQKQPPEPAYPWCPGNPTREHCAELGYCAKDPNCGE